MKNFNDTHLEQPACVCPFHIVKRTKDNKKEWICPIHSIKKGDLIMKLQSKQNQQSQQSQQSQVQT